MKTLLLSDLHLGSPLTNNDLELALLISNKSYDRIIFNGDIFDEWEESNLYSIFTMNYRFVRTLRDIMYIKPIIYITGNHDPKKDKLQKSFPSINFCNELSINNIKIIHGNEFDKFIIKYSWLAKLLYCVHWIFERFGFDIQSFSRNILHSVGMKKEKKYYNDLVFDIEENAVYKYKNDGYNILIMGHTHLPKFVIKDNFTYVNSGDWIYNKTYIELDDQTIKLINAKTGEINKYEYT